jgi:peptide chain release factor subunit 1
MLTRTDVETLLDRASTPGSPVLSVYLSVERSHVRDAAHYLETALRQQVRALKERLEGPARDAFAADAEHALQYVAHHSLKAQSLVLFCDASEDFLWARELHVPVRQTVQWLDTVYLSPLLEVWDDYERYGVILTDKTRARLFTVFLGEVEEAQEVFAPADVRHLVTTGTDHLWSQKRFQRRAEVHARWHLRQVAAAIDRLAYRLAFDRLILAGPVEATHELARLLPKRIQTRVVTTLTLPIDASEHLVLQGTLKIEQAIERAHERDVVETLLTAAAKHEHAVQGLPDTLRALQAGRIITLVYAEGFAPRGAQCAHCTSLLAAGQVPCPHCGGTVQEVEDLVERMVVRVWDAGGKVEHLRGAAAERLHQAGGIGAFLRYGSATLWQRYV